MRIKLFFICITIIITSIFNPLFSHKRALYNVIIDTDGGLDDFRAVSLFLASRDFNINAITSVDGVLEPYQTSYYLQLLIKEYHHEGIPIGKGQSFKASKKYRDHALPIWEKVFGKAEDKKFFDAVELMNFTLSNSKRPNIIIALGPLSNIEELIRKYPQSAQKIEMILWYANYEDNKVSGFNYEENRKAFEFLLNNHAPIKIIHNLDYKYDDNFFELCSEINSPYANMFVKFFKDSKYTLNYWDELTVLYLLYPSVFDEKISPNHLRDVKPKPGNFLDVLVTTILNSDKPDQGIVFNEIPTSGPMVTNDINVFAEQILKTYGYAEFKIVAITSEFHSHMGIYSILGAKTGLRIMEYLHIGLDEIEIISMAGLNPPISCFNDGLQVGTGSTLGYGTILVDTVEEYFPSAIVKYKGRTIKFSIKQEITQNIRKDVGELISKYGLESELYWKNLRQISIEKYWLKVNRYEMLDIEDLTDYNIYKR